MNMQKGVRQIFPGVYSVNGRLATESLAPGIKVYGEHLVSVGGQEYRSWDLYRSKLGAAVHKGLRELSVKPGSRVLYLGAASGTTPSHVSDIVGSEGIVFCVELSGRTMRDLVRTCEARENMIPLLADGRFPEKYSQAIEEEAGGSVDVVYQDVADPEQVRILESNCDAYLQKGGAAMVALKARSIDATLPPQAVFKKARAELSESFEIAQEIDLTPYDKDHMFFDLRKK